MFCNDDFFYFLLHSNNFLFFYHNLLLSDFANNLLWDALNQLIFLLRMCDKSQVLFLIYFFLIILFLTFFLF